MLASSLQVLGHADISIIGDGDTQRAGIFSHLDAFDGHVQSEFASAVLNSVGGARIGYLHMLVMLAPVFWQLLERRSFQKIWRFQYAAFSRCSYCALPRCRVVCILGSTLF